MKIKKILEGEQRSTPVTTNHRFSYEIAGKQYSVSTRQSRRREGLLAASYTISVQDPVGAEWLNGTCNILIKDFINQTRSEETNMMVYIELLPTNEPNIEATNELYNIIRHRPELSDPKWHFRLHSKLHQIELQYSPVPKYAPRGLGHEKSAL